MKMLQDCLLWPLCGWVGCVKSDKNHEAPYLQAVHHHCQEFGDLWWAIMIPMWLNPHANIMSPGRVQKPFSKAETLRFIFTLQCFSNKKTDPLQCSCRGISWTEESGKLQSMGLQRVGHDWVTNTFVGQAFRAYHSWILWLGCLLRL